MEILRFSPGDVLIMKKKHPCSSDRFRVLRTGSDVKICCEICRRELTMPREVLERSIKKVITENQGGNN
jgi:hypothetical protein